MKIDSVTFRSFRQHRNAEFDFSSQNSQLVVIKGNNGAGKTNFLNGVTWCLYETIDGSSSFSRESLVSQSDVLEAKSGDEIETEVVVAVTLGAGAKATIARRIFFAREDDGVHVIRNEFSVLAQEEVAAGYVNQVDPQDWVDSKLPKRFSPYFLFDGERLDRFFRESDARFIKDSVLQIAQVDILALTIKHLETLSEELTRDAAKLGGKEGEALAKEYEGVCQRLAEMEGKRDEARAAVDLAADSVNEAQGRLGEISVIAQLMEQRRQISGLHQDAIDRVQACEDELSGWAIQSGPAIFLREPLEVLQAEIDAARREQVLPPPFDPTALQGLLASGECICGRELDLKSDPWTHIEHVIAKYGVISEIGDALSRLEGPMLSSLATITRGVATSQSIRERLKRAMSDVQTLSAKLEKLNQSLAGHDDSQVALLHDQLKKAEASKDRAIDSRGRFSAEVDRLAEKRVQIEKKIASQKTQSLLAAETLRKSLFAKRTLLLAKRVYDELSNAVRSEVAANLDEQFKKMIWKQDFVDEVGIDGNFRVEVVNNRGFEILSELSAGERICLAFAYSLTLATVAGIRFPFVVDSPMGKLGPDVQDNLSEVLANETASRAGSEDQQLILLMTGTEYTPSVQKILARRDPTVFSIEYDVGVSETRIVKELN